MDLQKFPQYQELQNRLKQGWTTYNVYSVLSHVRMQDGLALNIALKEYSHGFYLKNTLIGRHAPKGTAPGLDGTQSTFFAPPIEEVEPGLHAYDHSYTEATVKCRLRKGLADEFDIMFLFSCALFFFAVPILYFCVYLRD